MEPFFVVVCVGIFLLVVLLSMGKKSSRSSRSGGKATSTFRKIADRFNTLEQVTQGLQKAGLEASQLIVAVDFTKSNLTQGKKTFGGKSLHAIGATPNPYERVIGLIGRTLSAFDDDNLIPAFGFGDSQSKGKSCFPFDFYYEPMKGFEAVLARYREISKSVVLSGPTNFAPVIHKAIEIVEETGEYTILLLLCDGQVTSQSATEAAIVEASKYPLAICIIVRPVNFFSFSRFGSHDALFHSTGRGRRAMGRDGALRR